MTDMQKPLDTGLSAYTTAEAAIAGIDLSGKTAIVTGGYSGLGTETVRVLRQAGASVIVPARDVDRARAALSGIEGVAVAAMDLMDPASIDRFAADFLAGGGKLDMLIHSAGIMASPLWRDDRGYEAQFSTNHLGHFQLATSLWPALQKAQGARIVAVSSWGHRYSDVHLDDPNFERRAYDPWLGYGQSKTANILFAVEADRRGQGDGIRAFSLHPGSIVDTNLGKHVPRENLLAAGVIDAEGRPVIDPARNFKTVAQGAATSVWCATSPQLDGLGGLYCENCDVAPLIRPEEIAAKRAEVQRFATRALGVMPYAVDPQSARELWELSEGLVRG